MRSTTTAAIELDVPRDIRNFVSIVWYGLPSEFTSKGNIVISVYLFSVPRLKNVKIENDNNQTEKLDEIEIKPMQRRTM
jgi:hypothetical protein